MLLRSSLLFQKTPGPEPRYVDKPDYGKVPEYLKDIKNIIEEEKAVIEEYLRDQKPIQTEDGYCEDLPEADRLNLIKKLKRKWGYLNSQYQNILGAESRSKKLQKEKFERQLTEVENDIKLLQRGPVRVRISDEF